MTAPRPVYDINDPCVFGVNGTTFAKQDANKAGVKYPMPDLVVIREEMPEDLPEIRLVYEDDNEYDDLAIRVDLPPGCYNGVTYPKAVKLGYIARDRNHEIRHKHPNNPPGAVIIDVIGLDKPNQGLLLYVDMDNMTAKSYHETDTDVIHIMPEPKKEYFDGFVI